MANLISLTRELSVENLVGTFRDEMRSKIVKMDYISSVATRISVSRCVIQ